MRIKNPKQKGSEFERIVKKLIQKYTPSAEVFRSPASLGSADLIEINNSNTPNQNVGSLVCLYQCKYLRKYMSKKETNRLVKDAERIGALAYLAYREKPRGKIFLDQLWPVVIQKISLN